MLSGRFRAGHPPRRVPVAGHRRHRVAQLRRQVVGVALAHEDDRLAPLAQRSHPRDQRAERRHRDLVPDALDHRRRVVRVLLLELVARRVVVLAPVELLDGTRNRFVVARHPHVAEGRQRVHDADHVRGSELRADEADERLAREHRRAPSHVVIVQEDREQPHVVALRLRLLVEEAADLAGGSRVLHLVDAHELERLDVLRLAGFGDREVGGRQVEHRVALPVGDDDVDADEVDAGPEDGLARGLSSCSAGGCPSVGAVASGCWPAGGRPWASSAGTGERAGSEGPEGDERDEAESLDHASPASAHVAHLPEPREIR
jgi:hypothetical protein